MPPTIGKPGLIRDVLLKGRTYEVSASFMLHGPVRDKDWGVEHIVHLNYVAEVQFTRRIDHNDSRRIEQFCQIKQSGMLTAEGTQGGSSIFVAFAARIGTVPVNGYGLAALRCYGAAMGCGSNVRKGCGASFVRQKMLRRLELTVA